ncbi:MAG: SDR family oxidoreductase [Candidatus Marinimicrobia bacterium]|jgi:NAD(P)-dependent dehydrogenase (short-subunit alcohol dehydrogenase family)|nr:SDR family oxidoreductase [Candidatus Neomarinimicrobiota bacterium]MDP7464698.1 SDR family oxidoreductase [Candidatus Neomarinimicrobiota bacterium]HJN69183.1 SDR family oxidoreductase [Candidatus Neomarinimicrobiota bacterium]
MSFENVKVVVTGGAKGIGGACVKAFMEGGAKVCILDIDQAGQEFADTLGDNTFFIHCDVSKEDEVKTAFKKIEKKLGAVEVLVNNAGIQRYSTVTETTEEEWDLIMNVNLKSAFLCSKYAIPMMLKKKKGCVINVASVQSFISQKNVAPYTTSKTALLGLTRSIAVDYAPNIRSVAVCPGTVDTPMLRNSIQESPNPDEVLEECNEMHLVKRICSSEEVGELITYLASDKAGFITGQAIRIDGGLGVTIGGSKRD